MQPIDVNGEFDRMQDGWIESWSRGDPAHIRLQGSGDERFVRFHLAQPGAAMISRRVALDSSWETLDLAVDLQAKDLARGEQAWMTGRLEYLFFDANGGRVGGWPWIGLRQDGDTPWTTLRAENVQIPPTATELSLALGMWNASGTVDVRRLVVQPGRTQATPESAESRPTDQMHRAWSQDEPERISALREVVDLAGNWLFMPGRGAASRKPTEDWGVAKVPGNWHDAVVARGQGDPWSRFEPKAINKAWYQRSVQVPAAWRGRAVVLEFDRISTDAMVWINGTEVGEIHWPAGQIDITDAVTFGEMNEIRVMVLAMNDREQVVHYMGYVDEPTAKADLNTRGITGSVTLRARPAGPHIAGVNVRPSVREQKLYLDLELAGVEQGGDVAVDAEMRDESGTVETTLRGSAPVEPVAQQVVTLALDWPNPRLWDYQQPNLYTMVLRASGVGMEDEIVQPFGFREFWIDGRDFYLNGTQIHLRPGNLQYGAMPEHLMKQQMNFGHHWPEDQVRRGVLSDYDLPSIEQADRIGLLVDANVAHMRWYVDRWENPAVRDEYRRIVEHQVRKYRNHPSVVMYTHSANAFQWQGDGDPWDIGLTEFSSLQEYEVRYRRVLEAIGMIKELDPKPVYAHFGTYNGDVYTSNMYLNFIPLQEREEWLSHWAQHGELPYMSVEMGPPLYSSVMRGRDGYTHQGHSEPLPTEWSAVYLGSKAYELEKPAFRDLLIERFKGGDLQKEYDPHIRHDRKELVIVNDTAFKAVLDLFITHTWRSWRTMDLSGGMIPWHHEDVPALERVNGPTLAWIAGSGGVPDQRVDAEDAFTEKSHHFLPGQSVNKQIVLINDLREPAPFSATWSVLIDGRTLAEDEIQGTLDVAEIRFEPVVAKLPADVRGDKLRGELRLVAKIGEKEHTDSFTFDVIAPAAPLNLKVAMYDPHGDTAAYLSSLGCTIVPWDEGQPAADVAVVGRHALSGGGQIPGDIASFVRDGGRLLVMAQLPQWTEHALHLRTAPHLSRRVFPVDAEHPVTAGLDEQNLRNWNGSSTLVEGYPRYPGFEWVPTYGWHWGNRHAVSSTPVEKPHRSSWRPILESEFDLAYTPLMEMDFGRGRVTLCTLDLEGRSAADPAADRLAVQLLRHVADADLPGKVDRVTYLGGDAGATLLAELGVLHERVHTFDPTADLVILGEEAAIDDAVLRRYVQQGGRLLVLRQTADRGPLGAVYTEQTGYHGSLTPPRWPEAAGLSASDLRWRSHAPAWLIAGGSGIEIGADGQLGRMSLGKGVVLFAQLSPDAVPAEKQRYFRFTRWRQTRALSQVLANLGATFEQDAKMLALLKTPDHYISLAGDDWLASLVDARPESPDRKWNAFEDISERARRLVQPGASTDAFEPVIVPGYMESYGPKWRWVDGEVVFRHTFDWPAYAADKPLFISVGRVDENEMTFLNGTLVGKSRHWLLPRGHVAPAGLVQPGANTLALRVWDEGIHGGMAGSPNHLYLAVRGEDPGFYHPDYLGDGIDEGTTEKQWEQAHQQRKIADNPYRYYRW